MPTPRPAVKGLVQQDGRYMLLKQRVSDGVLWTLPGGKVRFGESPSDALSREIDEEVGLAVDVGRPVGIYDFRYDDVHVVATVIACSPQTESPRVDTTANPADEKIVGHEWIPTDTDLVDRRTNPGLTRVLTSSSER